MAEEATQDQRAVLLETLYNDDEIRPALQALIAKKHPKTIATMPDFSARQEIDKAKAEWRKEVDAEKASRDAERNAGELARRRAEIKQGFTGRDGQRVQVTDDDVAAIEKLMVEEGIASHRAAAELYTAQRRIAAPSATHSRSVYLPGTGLDARDDYKFLEPGLKGDRSALDRAARDEAERVWADLRAGGSRADHWLSRYGG